MTPFMLRKNVINGCTVLRQLLITVGTLPSPGFEDVLSKFSTGKFRR